MKLRPSEQTARYKQPETPNLFGIREFNEQYEEGYETD